MFAQGIAASIPLLAVLVNAHPRAAGAEVDRRTTYSGTGTVYGGGGKGYCGYDTNANGMEAAIPPSFMPDSCNKTITVKNTGSNTNNAHGTGTSVTLTVTNECPSCGDYGVDMTTAAWNAITDNGAEGTITVEWSFT